MVAAFAAAIALLAACLGCSDQKAAWNTIDKDCAEVTKIKQAEQKHKRWQLEQIRKIRQEQINARANKNFR